jgi:hypothetical protein
MPFGFRKSVRLLGGLVRLNVSRSGVSVTGDLGPVSVNSRSRRLRADLPGPLSWTSRRLGRRRRPGHGAR